MVSSYCSAVKKGCAQLWSVALCDVGLRDMQKRPEEGKAELFKDKRMRLFCELTLTLY